MTGSEIGNLLGGIQRDPGGRITGATTLALSLLMKQEFVSIAGMPRALKAQEWEKAALETAADLDASSADFDVER